MYAILNPQLLIFKIFFQIFILLSFFNISLYAENDTKKLVYLVSDINIPFWKTLSKGIQTKAKEKGYEVSILTANNLKKEEIKNTIQAIKSKVDGIIISPINSSTAVTVLRFAKSANIPVIISDIGTDRGEYLSFISSNNYEGAYQIGKILTKRMEELNIAKDGTVGIIAIPQQRSNGKDRTEGFINALNESRIKIAGLVQQSTFKYKETYNYTLDLIYNNPNLKAIWLQTSNNYQAAIDAIAYTKKTGKILLVSFDAEPEFLELIPKGIILSAAMQQPFYMGERAVQTLDDFFNGKKIIQKQELQILAISTNNIKEKLSLIKRNVLGIINEK